MKEFIFRTVIDLLLVFNNVNSTRTEPELCGTPIRYTRNGVVHFENYTIT